MQPKPGAREVACILSPLAAMVEHIDLRHMLVKAIPIWPVRTLVAGERRT